MGRLVVHSELITSENFDVLPNMELHHGEAFTRLSINEFFEDKRLVKVNHVSFVEDLNTVSDKTPVFVVKPHPAARVPSLLVSRLLLDLGQDALGSFHGLHSLVSLFEEALIKK